MTPLEVLQAHLEADGFLLEQAERKYEGASKASKAAHVEVREAQKRIAELRRAMRVLIDAES